MRSLHPLSASVLLLLLAACGDAPAPVVVVHASDPHLLDGKRPAQEALNLVAFASMMNAVHGGAAGSSHSRILVISGDLGLEATNPRYVAKPAGKAQIFDSTRARYDFTRIVTSVTDQINTGPFRRVFFVPGNNDVLLGRCA